MNNESKIKREIRTLLYLFIAGLFVSGVTAFPLHTEVTLIHSFLREQNISNGLSRWIEEVYDGLESMDRQFPFMAYGTDWLAFAHLLFAVLFIGVVRDPVRNIWVIEFGLIACAAIIPLALIAGTYRGIPFFWRMIDCSFGVVGGSLLWLCYRKVRLLSRHSSGSGKHKVMLFAALDPQPQPGEDIILANKRRE